MGMPGDGEPIRQKPDWSQDTPEEWIEVLIEAVLHQGTRIVELERRLEDVMEANNLWSGR